MKIVIIPSADLAYNSGSVIYAKLLFEYLIDKGHEVYMLGMCVPNDVDENKKNRIKVKENLLFHPIIDDRPIENIQYLRMGSDILDALIEIYQEWGGIDIIHAHYASINSYFGSIVKHFVGAKVIVSSFGRDLNIGYEFNELFKFMIDYSYEIADKIVVPEVFLKNKILKMFPGIQHDKIEICPMPLDDKVLSTGEFVERDENMITFATVNSCFTPEKGIENIIVAFAEIIKIYKNCRLFIAGQDDDELLVNDKRLRDLVEKCRIQDKVIFTGFLSRSDVGRLLNSTDIFIDARIKGNFSSVLLEAEYKHKIIIASSNEGSKKIICDRINGMLFRGGDVADLVEKIEYVIKNEALKKRLVLGTELWCANEGKEYEAGVCMNKILQIYKKSMI